MVEAKRLRCIFIANRGEIAQRVIRTCRRLGIETVLGVSDADLQSVPARYADRAVRIGPARPAQSYLDIDALIGAARASAADSVHPGYGFVSENMRFARACKRAGLAFIGPTERQLEAVGDKLRAREHAVAAGLPVVPGGAVSDAGEAIALAGRIGYPVLIKAVGGGGGRGMKRVHEAGEMKHMAELAMAEADAAFGDARIYVERFIEHGRHIEVQVLGDGNGRIVHLGERDCSVQRRYQKLIEEAPAPHLTPDLRAKLHDAGVSYGKHLKYRGAGTIEFMVDAARSEFYFLEMNARIQVEHPVSEMVTGLDLVAEQIRIAEGAGLSCVQADITSSGHAIECRINAEDADNDFRPSPGMITHAVFPAGPGVRIDTHIEAGARVPPFYDSLLAKIIVHGPDRTAAISLMRAALGHCRIEGVHTNLVLQRALMADDEFMRGGVDTSFLTRFLERPDTRPRMRESAGSGGTHG